ncbi:MAG: acyltransferase [Flaviaesturariibacter sp.]|nr:acyltransferase [Flaviaesturariibacter sp.]
METIVRNYIATYYEDHGQLMIHANRIIFTRFDSLLFGFLGAYITYYKLWRKEKILFWLGLILFILMQLNKIVFGFNDLWKYGWFSLVPLSVFLMLPFLSSIKKGSGVTFKFITFTSMISYSIYLVHYTPFKRLLYPLVNDLPIIIQFLIYGICAYLFGFLLYTFIEKPFMRWRDKWLIRPIITSVGKT